MSKKILKNFHLGTGEELLKVYDTMQLLKPGGKGNFILTSQRLIFSGNVRGSRGAVTVETPLKDVNGGIKAGYSKATNKTAKGFGSIFLLLGLVIAGFWGALKFIFTAGFMFQIPFTTNTITFTAEKIYIVIVGGGLFLLGLLFLLIKTNLFYLEILSKSQSSEFLKFSTKDKKSKDLISAIFVNPDKSLRELVLNLGTDILNAQQFNSTKSGNSIIMNDDLDLFIEPKGKKNKKSKKSEEKEKISLLNED